LATTIGFRSAAPPVHCPHIRVSCQPSSDKCSGDRTKHERLCPAQFFLVFYRKLRERFSQIGSDAKVIHFSTVSCFYGSSTGQLGTRRLDGLISKGIFRFPFYLPQGKVALFQGSWFKKRNKYPMYIYPTWWVGLSFVSPIAGARWAFWSSFTRAGN
jgi:hypothetical protein